MARSVNLAPWGAVLADAAWLHIQQDDLFRRIRQIGFTAVRIPICFSALRGEDADPNTRLDEGRLQRVERLVRLAQRAGLAVMLSADADGRSEDRRALRDLLRDWRDLAAHFRPLATGLYFEIIDAPDSRHSPADWSRMADAIRREIRSQQPGRVILIAAPRGGDLAQLTALKLEPDALSMVSFVYDEPRTFTQPSRSSDATWIGRPEELARIEADLDRAARWGAENNRRLFCSSFGVAADADPQSRINWTTAVARALERRGIAWCYAALDGPAGVYDEMWRIWRQPLTGALLNP